MRVLSVVGARPQFIKAAMVSKELRKNNFEILVHTGQHYDYNMSEKFFEELGIPHPDYNLGISGGSHAQMTGKMMMAIEEVMLKETPDCVLLYGDTNSTLSAALVAAKLHIPIAHVEAGVRFHNMNSPEEINRICTDHLASINLVCTESGMVELQHEGLGERSMLVGDPMYDAFVEYSQKLKISDISLKTLNGINVTIDSDFYYLTCHREENTKDKNTLVEILSAMNSLEYPTVYPVHPRNVNTVMELRQDNKWDNIIFCEPVGYLESMALVRNAVKIVTDSGGLQREAFFARKKCVTVLDFVVWPETVVAGRNEMAHPTQKDILEKLNNPQIIDDTYTPFGDGHSAIRIVKAIEGK